MPSPHNVVHLNKQTTNQRHADSVKLPLSVIKLRDRCGQHLRKLMAKLFQQVDDTLFEHAERATNNSDQTRFFDAMREVRLKKDQVIALCVQGVSEDFGFPRRHKSRSDVNDMDSLTVMANEELEEHVASDTMVRRATELAGRELEHVTLRLDAIIPGILVEADNNPLGPQRLTENFMDACGTMDIDIQARLMLYKLYEKQVLVHLGRVYEAANKYLVDQGIMPDLHNTSRAAASRPGTDIYGRGASGVSGAAPGSAGALSGAQAGMPADGGADTFEMLRQLLGQMNGQPMGYVPPVNQPVQPIMPQHTLMHVLSQVQQQVAPQVMQPLDYQAILEPAQKAKGASIGAMDQDVMNLVSMLFEYILSDRNIPAKIKALLGRLQIPVLKVALLDRSFFSQSDHAARRLLNDLAASAIGWNEVEEGEDPFLARVEYIVDTLVNEFDQDVGLFERILAEFSVFAEGEKKRRRLLEQRIRDAENGKAKSDLARKAVQSALNAQLAGYQVPALTLKLLHDAWSHYMVFIALRHGQGSEDWAQAEDVARQVIQGTLNDDDLEALDLDDIQALVARLHAGLTEASFPEFDKERLLSKVEGLLVETAQARVVRSVDSDDGFQAFDQPSNVVDAGAEEVTSLVEEEEREEVEGVLQLLEEEEPEEEPEEPVSSDAMVAVDDLQVGCWVEIRENETCRYRARLAAIVPTTGKYIFVNRLGVKLAEKSRIALALALRHGSVAVLDNSQLFDRALESVIGDLRSGKGESA